MVYVGFGFLLMFTGRHSWTSVALNYLLSAFAWQWSVLCYGFWDRVGFNPDFSRKIPLTIDTLIIADFSAATVMVSFSGVLGKLSPVQYLIMTFIEVIFIATNNFIGQYRFNAVDFGGSMYIHTFGAYYALACSWIMFFKAKKTSPLHHPSNITTYNSDSFAMVGTLFLWLFWPSFNSAIADGAAQHRAVINTLLSICASCTATFAISTLFRGKFGMPEVQNSTLAGGVAMGAASVMNIQPWAAILVGLCAGSVSTFGYIYLTPYLEKLIGLHDTAGIHNLHGMPGVIGSLAAIFAALHANEDNYGEGLTVVFPARAPYNASWYDPSGLLIRGMNRTASDQARLQAATFGTTLGIAIASGLLTGLFLRLPIWDQPKRKDQFVDTKWFVEANPPSASSSSAEGEEDEEDDNL